MAPFTIHRFTTGDVWATIERPHVRGQSSPLYAFSPDTRLPEPDQIDSYTCHPGTRVILSPTPVILSV